ncbi:hypothetical protein BC628DRAFT_734585 [Trametes gibbosa]|nr:hypothetical protein BC628DRAFT_734585 [Trametes gibbosa]
MDPVHPSELAARRPRAELNRTVLGRARERRALEAKRATGGSLLSDMYNTVQRIEGDADGQARARAVDTWMAHETVYGVLSLSPFHMRAALPVGLETGRKGRRLCSRPLRPRARPDPTVLDVRIPKLCLSSQCRRRRRTRSSSSSSSTYAPRPRHPPRTAADTSYAQGATAAAGARIYIHTIPCI